ncbi:MAG: hypothetical protein ABTQ27_06755 [Amaricoccus sp.]|uniref:hypothetical protein n=1 Tax=Amaricoccus sp. TaxID=1872485 RepID=UPI00331556C7
MKMSHTLALVGALLAAGTTASFADTIGQRIASGKMSVAAAEQLIVGTGLSFDEAKGYTIDQVVALRWQDN